MGRRARVACGGFSALFGLLGVGLITAGLVVVLKVVPDNVNDTIKKDKLLVKNADGTYNSFTKDWVNPQYISTMQYWVYDYKNALGIINRGQLPDVDEKGPYAYREETFNNITWVSEDGTEMRYTEQTRYVFDKTQSCLGCDPYKDTVLVPDISYMEMIPNLQSLQMLCQFLYDTDPSIADLCNTLMLFEDLYDKDVVPLIGDALDAFDSGPFVRVTVDQLLFSGYPSPVVGKFFTHLLEIVMDLMSIIFQIPMPPPSIPPVNVSYGQSMYSAGPLYTIYTGKSDENKVGFVKSFEMVDPDNSSATLESEGSLLPEKWWNGSCPNGIRARQIQGNTGSYFPSFLKKGDTVPLYVDTICRSVKLQYEKEITYKDIDGFRFILPASEFDWSDPANCGFCRKLDKHTYYDKQINDSCLPSGLLDISQCEPGNAPIVISRPHFYQADPVVQNFVPRFKPSYDDEITMDVEPQTGTILAANKRLQVNLLSPQVPKINSMKVFRPGAYPIFWLNESFYADSGTTDDLKSDLIDKVRTYRIVCYSAVGVGGLLIVVAILSCFGIAFCGHRKEE